MEAAAEHVGFPAGVRLSMPLRLSLSAAAGGRKHDKALATLLLKVPGSLWRQTGQRARCSWLICSVQACSLLSRRACSASCPKAHKYAPGTGLTHTAALAVIKPIFGAASIGVVRVNSREKLREVFLRVQKEMASVRIDAGAITQGTADDAVRFLCCSACFCKPTAVDAHTRAVLRHSLAWRSLCTAAAIGPAWCCKTS